MLSKDCVAARAHQGVSEIWVGLRWMVSRPPELSVRHRADADLQTYRLVDDSGHEDTKVVGLPHFDFTDALEQAVSDLFHKAARL